MFCSRCGQQFSDDSRECPICGKAVVLPKNTTSTALAAPSSQSREEDSNSSSSESDSDSSKSKSKSKSSDSFDYDIGGFLSGFLKDPINSCTDRAVKEFFLLGLTFPALILAVNLLSCWIFKKNAAYFNLLTGFWPNTDSRYFFALGVSQNFGFWRSIITVFVDFFAFGTMVLFVFLAYGLFKVKRVGFLATVSWIGLALFPYSILNLFSWIWTAIYYHSQSSALINISPILKTFGLVFFIVCLYDFFFDNLKPKGTQKHAMRFVVMTCVVFTFCEIFYGFILGKAFLH
ncbi:MAG: hypothetical protein IKH92_10585 [Clostridiales bacterium]|nr:hypothetical protein [Clostridiales bacterium]